MFFSKIHLSDKCKSGFEWHLYNGGRDVVFDSLDFYLFLGLGLAVIDQYSPFSCDWD